MYHHNVNISALTNLDSWIVLEKQNKTTLAITQLNGIVGGKSNTLNIVLAMTNQVAGERLGEASDRIEVDTD